MVLGRNLPRTPQLSNLKSNQDTGSVRRGHLFEFLENLRTPSVAEKIGKMLRFLGSTYKIPGEIIPLFRWEIDGQLNVMASAEIGEQEDFPSDPASEEVCRQQLPFLSAGWAASQSEINFLFESLHETGLLKPHQSGNYEISPAGWEAIESRPETEGTVGFVAMAFADEMTPIWTGPISSGISAAGYQPFRVDQKEHNNDITDEIIAAIRTSKFVFADFTNHRAGVYYEAGFAAGLSIPVIRSVRADQSKDLHFDTRQMNHLLWEPENLKGFEIAITNRIIATIGRGPIPG